MASLFPACFPPLIKLNAGTGNIYFFVLREGFEIYLIYSYNLIFLWAAAALANAKETGKIAFAPSFDFDHPNWFLVPSNT